MRSLTVVLCVLAGCVPPRTSHRIIAGVSMGAVGASAVGLRHPLDFDGIAALGGPLDAAFLGHAMARSYLGGFCSLAELEAVAAKDPAALDDPAALAHCMTVPKATMQNEREQSFVRWQFTTNGAVTDRDAYLDLFEDLVHAFGNPFVDMPPGAPSCAMPIVVSGLKNAEYNPDGRYNAITFCDGEEKPVYVCARTGRVVDFCNGRPRKSEEAEHAARFCGDEGVAIASETEHADAYFDENGRYDPCREHTRPVTMALAVDINGNGRRDYGEPVVQNAAERYDDVGSDGCENDREDGRGGCLKVVNAAPAGGDPNGDDYDPLARPRGTEQNWKHDDGEPYRDFGLDGVAKSGDFGEGNGRWDMSPAMLKIAQHDPRTRLERFPKALQDRLDFLVDGGIRDVFNFGVQAQVFFGAVPKREGNTFFLYGREDATQEEIRAGDGGHVGTTEQVVERVLRLMRWSSERFAYLGKDDSGRGGTEAAARLLDATYESKALGATRDYAIFLPPGYDREGNTARYPVLYLLHGYGMRASGPNGLSFAGPVADPFMRDEGIRKMILVFPSGTCCFRGPDGTRACTELDPQGLPYELQPAFTRECHSGSFYVNDYEAALMELVAHVDATYRTLPVVNENRSGH